MFEASPASVNKRAGWTAANARNVAPLIRRHANDNPKPLIALAPERFVD